MQTSIRGELTEEASPLTSFRERAFVSSVAQILASSRNINDVEQALYPVLMCAAAANDDVDALIRMVEGGANVNAKDYEGRTPLHVAAISDASLSAAYLLAHGAQYDLVDKAGKTALDEALRMESHQVLALLRERY
jgi:lysophospholipase